MAQQLVVHDEDWTEYMLKAGRWDHRNLLPDETCDRVFCVWCGNTPQPSEEARQYGRYA